ncbi:hypothetical protein OPQ81_000920 [Rhizoctonia solani]|nr:hypothetical protein OPQ81_000920 [Rhizoctonia solani]
MCLLWRLKVEHPGIRLTHGHGMYLAALSLAEKMTGHEDCSLEDWAMVGQWIFSAEQLEMYQQCLGGLLLWKLEFDTEDMARIVEHVQCGRQPDVEPISFPAEYDDDCAESIRPISTSSLLSTCTIPSTWSLCSMHGWDESTRKDSVMMAAPGEKGNTNPYADTESQRNLAALNVLETPNSSFNSFDS